MVKKTSGSALRRSPRIKAKSSQPSSTPRGPSRSPTPGYTSMDTSSDSPAPAPISTPTRSPPPRTPKNKRASPKKIKRSPPFQLAYKNMMKENGPYLRCVAILAEKKKEMGLFRDRMSMPPPEDLEYVEPPKKAHRNRRR